MDRTGRELFLGKVAGMREREREHWSRITLSICVVVVTCTTEKDLPVSLRMAFSSGQGRVVHALSLKTAEPL
eukprot:6476488-Amphidinium_carterae.1